MAKKVQIDKYDYLASLQAELAEGCMRRNDEAKSVSRNKVSQKIIREIWDVGNDLIYHNEYVSTIRLGDRMIMESFLTMLMHELKEHNFFGSRK